MKKLYKKVIFVLILFGILSVVFNALALEPEKKVLELKWPSSPIGTRLENDSTFPDLVKYFYEWGISLGGLVAFISLVMAGFQYITSAGNAGKMKEARDQIDSAVLGLVLLLSSFLVLETINPQLTIFEPHEFILETPPYPIIELLGLSDIKKPCEEVLIYADSQCTGDSYPAQIGSCTPNIYFHLKDNFPNCIKAVTGNCNTIHLYTSTACGDEFLKVTVGILESGKLSIKSYHADGQIRSIYVESGSEGFDGGLDNNCEIDCSDCDEPGCNDRGVTECTWLPSFYGGQCITAGEEQEID